MRPSSALYRKPGKWGKAVLRELASWRKLIYLGLIALVVALSPATYGRSNRGAIPRCIYASTWQVLPWFTMVSALISLVLIRVVVVTALSYGLSQYALEMVVRVLVLELIPLSAALFVALREGLTFSSAGAPGAAPLDSGRLRSDFVPQVIASAFSVLSLALMSSLLVLVLAYVNVYGLSPWGLAYYTRTVGRVFDPVVSIGFLFKTVLFGLAVAVIPMAAALEARAVRPAATVQPGAIRLFFALFMIEAASLAVKYI